MGRYVNVVYISESLLGGGQICQKKPKWTDASNDSNNNLTQLISALIEGANWGLAERFINEQ